MSRNTSQQTVKHVAEMRTVSALRSTRCVSSMPLSARGSMTPAGSLFGRRSNSAPTMVTVRICASTMQMKSHGLLMSVNSVKFRCTKAHSLCLAATFEIEFVPTTSGSGVLLPSPARQLVALEALALGRDWDQKRAHGQKLGSVGFRIQGPSITIRC
jgi:hypothetical protein